MGVIAIVVGATVLILAVAVAGVQVGATKVRRQREPDDDEHVLCGRLTW